MQVLYPRSAELMEIDQDFLKQLVNDDIIFREFPFRESPASMVTWEQRDNYTGLMQLRGLNQPAAQAPTFGFNRYNMNPGIWGEKATITEQEIVERAAPGTFATPIPIGDLMTERSEQLMTRQINRQRQLMWTMLSTGVIQVVNPNSAPAYSDSYTSQLYSATVPWATSATATPLQDFRNVWKLHLGHSVTFGHDALAFMNYVTYNNFISNSNATDLYGRRTQGLGTINSLEQYNAELATRDDLPNIIIYDENYITDAGVATRFIPDNTVIVLGKRLNNARLGNFVYTRNANNPGLSSMPYYVIADNISDSRPQGVESLEFNGTRRIEVHRGFNGGLAIHYPSAVVVMSV